MKVFRLFNVLTIKEKFGFLFYFIIFYFSYLLEMFGIGLVIPLLSDGDVKKIDTGINILNKLFERVEGLQVSEILILMILLIILKNFFLIFSNFFNQYLYCKLNTRLSKLVFSYYLNLEYKALLKNKIHSINRKVMLEVPVFVDNLVRHIDFLIFSILFIVYIVFGLTVFTEALYLIIPTLFFLLLINQFFIKKKLKDYGKLRVDADDSINNAIVEFLPGLKEIIIFGLKSKLIKEFATQINNKFNVIFKLNFLTKNNKSVFELTIFFFVFCFFVILNKEKTYNLNDYLPLIIFCAALFARSIPVLSEVFSIRQKIMFSSSSVTQMLNEFDKICKKNTTIDLTNIGNKFETLEIKNLFFSYDNVEIFKNLKFKVDNNFKKLNLLYGKNGSGKSTLMNIISGILVPQSGECLIDGKKISFKNLSHIVSLSPQDTILFNGTIKENITMSFFSKKKVIDEKKLEQAIKFSDLKEFIDSFEKKIDHRITDGGKNMSGGQKQRIGFARALYKDTKIIILDEPTNNLDRNGIDNLMINLEKLTSKKIVIVITHDQALRKLNTINYEIKDKKILKLND